MIIKIILLSLLTGIFYRFGGKSRPFRSWMRDWICPLLILISLCLLRGFHWSMIICYPLMGGALTTYEYFLPDLPTKTWINYALHGFFVSLALLPYAIATGLWFPFWARCVFNLLAVSGWSIALKQVDLEEGGRGFLFNSSILFFIA